MAQAHSRYTKVVLIASASARAIAPLLPTQLAPSLLGHAAIGHTEKGGEGSGGAEKGQEQGDEVRFFLFISERRISRGGSRKIRT